MQAVACFEGELGESCAEQERHDRVDEEEDAKGLEAGDDVGAGVFVREEEDDENGDTANGDVGAAEGGCVGAERVGLFAVVAQQGCQDD